MAEAQISAVKRRLIKVLEAERRPMSFSELQRRVDVSSSLLLRGVFELYKNGVIDRVYSEDFDPTRPFDTALWILRPGKKARIEVAEPRAGGVREEVKGPQDFRLVLSVPLTLHAQRTAFLNRHSAMDIFDAFEYVVNLAEKDLKIVCPVLDAYGFFPVVNRLHRAPDLKVRIITELDKSRDVMYFAEVAGPRRILVVDALKLIETPQGGQRKVEGVHAKMAIADNKAALIGSFNFSRHHYLVNFDAGFLIHSQPVIELLSSLFEELWRHVNPGN